MTVVNAAFKIPFKPLFNDNEALVTKQVTNTRKYEVIAIFLVYLIVPHVFLEKSSFILMAKSVLKLCWKGWYY